MAAISLREGMSLVILICIRELVSGQLIVRRLDRTGELGPTAAW